MSLQDILMKRAAIHFRDQLGNYNGPKSNLWKNISSAIEEEKDKKLAAEEEKKKFSLLTSGSGINPDGSGGNTDKTKLGNLVMSGSYEPGKGTTIKYKTPTPEIAQGKKRQILLNELDKPDSIVTKIDLMSVGFSNSDADGLLEGKHIANAQLGSSLAQLEQPDFNAEQPTINTEQQVTNVDGTIPQGGGGTGNAIVKGIDVEKNIPKDVVTKTGIKEEAFTKKWSEAGVDKQINFQVLEPKLIQLGMEGARGYQELKRVAKETLNIDLDFSKQGPNQIVNMLVQKGLSMAQLTPYLDAIDALRPELGAELMRQIGPFRSAAMAKDFQNTLPKFTGNFRADLARTVTTMTKNASNANLVDSQGRPLSTDQKLAKMDSAAANYIRKYNAVYMGMGVIDEPYHAERTPSWIAEHSTFNEKENAAIDSVANANPNYSREAIVTQMIKRGDL